MESVSLFGAPVEKSVIDETRQVFNRMLKDESDGVALQANIAALHDLKKLSFGAAPEHSESLAVLKKNGLLTAKGQVPDSVGRVALSYLQGASYELRVLDKPMNFLLGSPLRTVRASRPSMGHRSNLTAG